MFPVRTARAAAAILSIVLAACDSGGGAASTAAANAPDGSAAPGSDMKAVATNLVNAALVRRGDKVLIFGNARDMALLEDVAIETMKRGAEPIISVGSEALLRRSYTETDESYDNIKALDLALVNVFDAMISVTALESDAALASVPPSRIAARARTEAEVEAAVLKRGRRSVFLGNDLYPMPSVAARLGIPLSDLRAIFWKAAATAPEDIRVVAEPVRMALVASKEVKITSPAGTDLTLAVDAGKAFVSDGALNPGALKQGGAVLNTWLPAGEILAPTMRGSANGKIVVEKIVFNGNEVSGLTIEVKNGVVTSMAATSGLERIKAVYDSATVGKDELSWFDLGLNPDVTLPTQTGALVWMASGAVTLGLGNSLSWNGTNSSNFYFPMPISKATVVVDGKTVVENGALKK